MIINPKGDPSSKIWIVVDKPYDKDKDKGYLFSGTMGWIFDNVWREAGLSSLCTPYIYSLKADTDSPLSDSDSMQLFESEVTKYAPPFIIPLGWDAAALICPETKARKKPFKAALDKYAGSLLVSPFVPHPHYCVPTYAPDYICSDWGYREIQVFIDLGRVKEEYEYYVKNQCLQPLPNYSLLLAPSFEELVACLQSYLDGYNQNTISFLSSDIETIRPIKGSEFRGNPGYPYTIALAPNANSAVSFSLWDYHDSQGAAIWRLLDELLARVPQIGQNYFNFDSHYLAALGFKRICLSQCQDTMIRHHILWPELEHKLQFLTKQYTRQSYYKDEGKGWHPKRKQQLFRYNALDAVVTYKVYEGQEEEFKDRPHLR